MHWSLRARSHGIITGKKTPEKHKDLFEQGGQRIVQRAARLGGGFGEARLVRTWVAYLVQILRQWQWHQHDRHFQPADPLAQDSAHQEQSDVLWESYAGSGW